jgi:thioredoxin 1
MSENVMEITKDNFESIASENPNLVIDCWASWCGPCRQMGPIFEKLAEENASRAAFGKMDCDRNPELVKMFKVMAIPTILLIKEGKVAETIIGLVPREEIESALNKTFSH